MIKFSILVPTRNRPHNMQRLCQHVFDTVDRPAETEVVFYIDDDDPASVADAEELRLKYNIEYFVGERIVLSKCWNKCHEISKGDYLMLCCDECVMRTQGWDTIVENKFKEFEDKIAFVYGDDMNPGSSPDFGAYGFLHKNWTRTVGYFVPPYFSSDYNDTWLNDVSKSLNRHAKANFQAEHFHPGCGKAEWDHTHQERMARHQADQVGVLYASLAQERQNDVEKLKNFIESYV